MSDELRRLNWKAAFTACIRTLNLLLSLSLSRLRSTTSYPCPTKKYQSFIMHGLHKCQPPHINISLVGLSMDDRVIPCRRVFLFRNIYVSPATTSKTWPRPRGSDLDLGHGRLDLFLGLLVLTSTLATEGLTWASACWFWPRPWPRKT